LDITLGKDTDIDVSVNELISDMCASDESMANMHDRLSVSSMLVAGISEVSFCSSDYLSERNDIADRSKLAFRAHGVDPTQTPDSGILGVFEIYIEDPDDVTSSEYYMRQLCMHDGLRYILNGWARNRDRIMLVSFHAAQHIEGDDRLMPDHVHVVYERHFSDPANFLQDEIASIVEEELRWDTIEAALGTDEEGA
jgi:hypothetical protein